VKKFSREIVVGLFATIALVLLYFGWYYLKGVDFFSSYKKYFVVYDNVDQLAISNPVLLNGFRVGQVGKIRIMQNRQDRVLVELDIDADVKLGDSTKATLTSEVLSGKYILLTVGPMGKKPLKSGDTLRAEVAKGLFDVFKETTEPVADNLQTTLRNFNIVIDNLVHNSKQLDTIFSRMQSTPWLINRTLNNTNGRIDELTASFKSVADNLNVTLSELKPTLQNFKTLSDSLKQLELNKTLLKTQQALNGIHETLVKLQKGDNTMSKLMTEDSLYVNLNKLLVNMDTLVNHFDNDPKRFMGPLGKSKRKIEKEKRRAERRKPASQKKE
jgi:phospholipid/cholesterol/gamma-HCH transport system substrate-binding protein